MASDYDKVFSDAGIAQLADALGIDLIAHENFGNEGEDEDSISEDTGDSTPIDQYQPTSPIADQNQSLNIPWPISIISTDIKTGQDGSKSVDLVVEFPEITGAGRYEYRITPV